MSDTLNLEMLKRAKTRLAELSARGWALLNEEPHFIDRRIDLHIIEEMERYWALAGWRCRFGDPANNPFR